MISARQFLLQKWPLTYKGIFTLTYNGMERDNENIYVTHTWALPQISYDEVLSKLSKIQYCEQSNDVGNLSMGLLAIHLHSFVTCPNLLPIFNLDCLSLIIRFWMCFIHYEYNFFFLEKHFLPICGLSLYFINNVF